LLLIFIIIFIVQHIEKQTRLIGRAMRHNAPLRHNANKEVLIRAVRIYIPEGMSRMALEEQLALLPDVVSSGAGDAMEVETKGEAEAKPEVDVPRTTVIPEVRWYKIIGCDDTLHPHFPYFIFVMPTIQKLQVEVYISLLVLTTLMQQGSANAKRCAEASASLFNTVQSLNRRSMDLLRAKVFHYFSLTHELYLGNISTLRPTLLEAHRMACIQHDEMGQATLLNLLLRSLLEENQVCIVVSFCWKCYW
jgi:hypothetical protein